ncbi:glycine cleavage system aminomethyltransferase GcvT [Aureibacter tunicatorum]|uniref:Aminomethyltransferase n=1 Tax=Aureibacter tunicatorum TaxID=866807 RepID=A0AAE4BTG2_9BACT|nr:glycine cleavage system aminomethyltransferase GcvT [Aureibacter tunicatorum]MDR6239803.1 aminomethyltransferase [Aureibacter tunicatorum]BDD04278.1 aminomethyltransferase [Aureibacter tunicatorum]
METTELKKIALNDVHESLGAKMVPFAGYNMPVRYTSDLEEHLKVRESVGVFDVSHMGEFFLRGPKALDLIQRVTSNDASKLFDGKAQYSCLPNEDGGIVDDLLVYRISEEEYMLVVNASNIEKDWNWISERNTEGVEMVNLSDEYSLFAVQGPKAHEAMQSLTEVNLKEMVYYTFEIAKFAGQDDVIISATGYTGAGGFELYVKNEAAVEVFNSILEAGKDWGIQPIGLGARDTLRLEKGFCLYGNDIDDTTSPLEAGLGWVTKFTKEFTNSENLKKQKEEGVKRRLVGFVLEEKGIPRHGYDIVDAEGQIIGKVTSGSLSPCMNSIGIGLGYVTKENSKAESEIFIQVRKKQLKAKVVKLPIYNG